MSTYVGQHGRKKRYGSGSRFPFTYDFRIPAAGGMTHAAFVAAYPLLDFARVGPGYTVQTSDRTLASGLTAADQPRIGQRGVAGSRGLVFEPESTNTWPDSNSVNIAFDGGNPGSLAVITPGFLVGPDGVALADRVVVASGGYSPYSYDRAGNTGVQPVESVGSCWVRSSVAPANYQVSEVQGPGDGTAPPYLAVADLTAAIWKKIDTLASVPNGGGAPPSANQFFPVDGRVPNLGAKDCCVAWMQMQSGKYPTEAILGVGFIAFPLGVIRKGERIFAPVGDNLIDAGCLTFVAQYIAKGGANEYATGGSSRYSIWYVNDTNQCYRRGIDGRVVVIVGGVTQVLGVMSGFNRFDTIEIVIRAGSISTVGRYRVNGGATQNLGAAPPLGPLSAPGALDYFGRPDPDTALPTDQFGAWMQTYTWEPKGTLPAWAIVQDVSIVSASQPFASVSPPVDQVSIISAAKPFTSASIPLSSATITSQAAPYTSISTVAPIFKNLTLNNIGVQGSNIWVGSGRGFTAGNHSVERVNGGALAPSVVAIVDLLPTGISQGTRGIESHGGLVYIAGRNTGLLLILDPATNTIVGRANVGAGIGAQCRANHIAFDVSGNVYVSNDLDGVSPFADNAQIAQFSIAAILAAFPGTAAPTQVWAHSNLNVAGGSMGKIVFGGGFIWAACGFGVLRLNPANGAVTLSAGANTFKMMISYAFGSVWVSSSTGLLLRYDAATFPGAPIASIAPSGGTVDAIMSDASTMWIASGPNTLNRISVGAGTEAIIATPVLGGAATQICSLALVGTDVWTCAVDTSAGQGLSRCSGGLGTEAFNYTIQ